MDFFTDENKGKWNREKRLTHRRNGAIGRFSEETVFLSRVDATQRILICQRGVIAAEKSPSP
jgi:hypothetical protein